MGYGECEKCGYAKFGNDKHDCLENLSTENAALRARLSALEEHLGKATITPPDAATDPGRC